mmetsp:Transcript_36942/g.95376  ORF Transcript_36942/g.95376 Transcript_36942/m.95376 type:complete len:237 (-) Transcript_36942:229-939(-)
MSRPVSSTCTRSSTERSATIAHCERHRDRRWWYWFRALSAWKSNTSRSPSKRLAVAAAKLLAPGSTRRQEVWSHASWSSWRKGLSAARCLGTILADRRRSSVGSRSSSATASSFSERGKHQFATTEPTNSSTRMPKGTVNSTVEMDHSLSAQWGAVINMQHSRPSTMMLPHALMASRAATSVPFTLRACAQSACAWWPFCSQTCLWHSLGTCDWTAFLNSPTARCTRSQLYRIRSL